MDYRNHAPRNGGPSRGCARSRSQRETRPHQSRSGRRAHGGGAPASSYSSSSSRFVIILGLFTLLALVFFVRLFYVQVIKADEYSAMAEETRTISFTTTARRGTIYDRNGTVLATSVDATTIYANPAEVTDAAYEAAKLAEVLGGDAEVYEERMRQTGTFVYIRRQADVDIAKQVKELDLDGIYFIPDTRREYPNGRIGGQILGFCDVDGNGITGLELYYDDILKGTPGTYSAERGEGGMPIPGGVHEDTPAVDGQDIMISLDIELQDKLEHALEEGTDYISAEGGSAVVMDAGTGEIYAAASLDYLDPSDLSNIVAGSDQLKAITQAFEPGSIFKTVSAMAILEAGTMSPEDELFCPAEIEASGYVVSDAYERDDATFTLRQIMDQSSNVGISLATENMGFELFYNKILQYNLNELTGVDYPGEQTGYLPGFDTWARITAYNISFGQGVSVTPLQMVRFYGMLINEGVQVTPHFLISKPITGEVPEYDTETVVTDQAALDTMVDMLTTVVEDGTGKGAAIYGYTVAGKTSTAEIAEGGTYREGVYNLCFTGFLPNSTSQLVCFVGANEVPDDGSVGFIFKDIMSYAIDRFKIAPE
ncbi:MAG: penicillin-binding protein 2 [Eggerthellaceae bacterium]|nr:penicillin-binding protein 2 [Eggerthellaceae bacterium]